MLFLGLDCGTQSTKVILVDIAKKQVLAEASSPHPLKSNPRGGKEQNPQHWIKAFKKGLDSLKNSLKDSLKGLPKKGLAEDLLLQIKGVGVSGQQHGLVLLDENKKVIRDAKLWCDTETVAENDYLLKKLGGIKGSEKALGLTLMTGYTASKLLWLKNHEKENYRRARHVLLPHDYINFYLTGNIFSEASDSSGTGYFNIKKRAWSQEVLHLIDSQRDLTKLLPPLIRSYEKHGVIRKRLAKELGLSDEVIVSSGGGDNLMAAIGSGNVEPGLVTMSLGTSGTLFTHSPQPLKGDHCLVNFCSARDNQGFKKTSWVPLICTMNITSTINYVRNIFKATEPDFFSLARKAEIGAEGITLLPFFNGERTPDLPQARASLHGLTASNFTRANIFRATLEGISFTLRYGLELFKKSMPIKEIRVIGGGAKDSFWCQLLADLMMLPIITLKNKEIAALGAALQAAWCYENQYENQGRAAGIKTEREISDIGGLVKPFIGLEKKYTPREKFSPSYQKAYEKYLALLKKNH